MNKINRDPTVMFKFIKKLFGGKNQATQTKRKSKKKTIEAERKTYNSPEEMERPALSYVKEIGLTKNQTNGIKNYVRYKTDYEHNYQYRLSEFIRDLKSGRIEKKASGVGKKTVEKILNQMKQDEVL